MTPIGGEVWTLSEFSHGHLQAVSLELLAWGRRLADDLGTALCAVVLGHHIPGDSLQTLIAHGADRVLVVDDPALANFLVRPQAQALRTLVEQHRPDVFLAAATTTGRTLMPYLCTGLAIDPETRLLLQTRPAIGGNIMATIKTPEARPQMATVRPRSKKPLPADPSRSGEIVHHATDGMNLYTPVEQLAFIPNDAQGGSIEEAEVIVAGGRAMKTAANFALLRQLAHLLGGAVGASRVPVDYGWQPYPRQIGLSGKTISPRLYIACGISGSIQHLAGIQTAEHIIAINKDPDAQIFQVADLGIVGDLYEILPAWIEMLQQSSPETHP
jgi:electron transfer flavoprotein alpha subunit